MNATSPDKNGFLVDVIHLLDDAAQTKAKLNHFCSYFSQNGSEKTNRDSLLHLTSYILSHTLLIYR